MENPGAVMRAPIARRTSSYYTGVVFVVALHLVVIWAFLNALGMVPRIIPAPPATFIPVIDKADPQPPATKPPEPTHFTTPQTPTVPAPLVPTGQTTDNNGGITVTTGDKPVVIAALPPDTGPASVAGTHTTPPYPTLARRLSQQGSVKLQIFVAADGAVSDVRVIGSSGSEELDRSAAAWVQANWRYRPAMRAGAAVAASTVAIVTFNLKDAR